MSQKRGGLGRNLSALLGQQNNVATIERAMWLECPITHLVPGRYQPRQVFDDASLTDLADSIQKQGVLQALLVREIAPKQYEIIAGERRWRASQLAGLTTVPVVVRQVDDETALGLALIENVQREDLSVVEQARAMQRLIEEFDLTHQHIAQLLSKSRASVSNHLRLLQLNPDVLRLLEHGDLEMGHARCLLTLSLEVQLQVAQMVIEKALSVRETERLVSRLKNGIAAQTPDPIHYPPHVQHKIAAIGSHLNAAVKLKSNASGRGTLVIHYDDWSGLEQIMSRMLE